MKKLYSLTLFLLVTITLCVAQNGSNPILLEDITGGKYYAYGTKMMRSLSDGEHYTSISSDSKSVLKYSYKTGEIVDTLFNVDKARETKLKSIQGYAIDSRTYRILVWNNVEYIYRRSWKADVYDYDVRRNYLKPLSDNEGKIMIPTFSPDGRMVAFVRDNNIWIKKFDYDTEIQITKDGELNKVLNGVTDWVYEEEFGQTNLMSWSADSKFLAYIKSDESGVKSFDFQYYKNNLYPESYVFKYPKAGEDNSKVACFVYNLESKDTKKMEVPLDDDGYIPSIQFTENIDQLAVMTLNRHQNNFNMYFVNPKSTVAKLILHDESKYYVDPDWILNIKFTKDNFVYVSEKDGYAHIYLYSMTGVLEKQLTSGNWDVTDLYGYNQETKTAYYQSAEESPIHRAVYKVDTKGNKIKLSTDKGTNSAVFSNNFKYYVNTFSNVTTPTLITLHNEKGKRLFILNDNEETKKRLEETKFRHKEFFTFTNEAGVELNGWIIKPSDFSDNKKYPAVMIQYSGPNSQQVKDAYGIDWYNYLAEQGYIVVSVDGRGTAARGEEFRKCTYLKLGLLESDDQISVAKYLSKQTYIDKDNIAIWGWSFGGFTTLMCMSRGNGILKAGVAIAAVTDWRFYDSIYTERFMRTPKENMNNYDLCSPIKLADKLKGRLFLVHGTADDNVHFQNAAEYMKALQNAGIQFNSMTYPDKNHSIVGGNIRTHLYTGVIDFLNIYLKGQI
ncbi:dipeptidyl-peptidase-4 [Dysgonomonadaceae bacterium PH5-43]|nr:dipeptidyl-peptidase-4 [Dysgonomonadaceae bacterium PH5-43]